jgi:hypothetical protein
MSPQKKPYGTVVVGMVFVGVGLVLAVLSEPRRFSLDPKADTQILLLTVSGAACTIFGVVMLLTAAGSTTKSMPPEKKTKTNAGVGIGFVLQLVGLILFGNGAVGALVGLLLVLISVPVFIWGCMNYAEGKGHSKWVGIVGLLGIIGLVILIVLPDQHEVAS